MKRLLITLMLTVLAMPRVFAVSPWQAPVPDPYVAWILAHPHPVERDRKEDRRLAPVERVTELDRLIALRLPVEREDEPVERDDRPIYDRKGFTQQRLYDKRGDGVTLLPLPAMERHEGHERGPSGGGDLAARALVLPQGVPDFCEDFDKETTQDGNFTAGSTWVGGVAPVAGDIVQISHDVTVTTQDPIEYLCVGVASGGLLTYQVNANTRLRTAVLLIYEGGEYRVGTAGSPIADANTADLVITDTNLDTDFDPEQYGTGFLAFGKVTMFGKVRTRYCAVTNEIEDTETSFALACSPTGWANPDRIVFHDTRQLPTLTFTNNVSWRVEERTVSGTVSGSTLNVTSGLTWDHPSFKDQSGATRYYPVLGNLSNNITVSSENPAGTRGHSIFIYRAVVDIQYVTFLNMGRTTDQPLDCTQRTVGAVQANPDPAAFGSSFCTVGTGAVTHIGTNHIGRYAIHFHHCFGHPTVPIASGTGAGYQQNFSFNVVEGATKWSIAVHNSHFGLFKQNFLYNGRAAAFMTEDGSEYHNMIDGNLIVLHQAVEASREAGGREAVGIYMRGPFNYVRNNIVSDLTSIAVDATFCFKPFFRFLANVTVPTNQGDDPSVSGTALNASDSPIPEFADNKCLGGVESGIAIWWVGFGLHNDNCDRDDIEGGAPQADCPDTSPQTIFDRYVCAHIWNKCVYNYDTSNNLWRDNVFLNTDNFDTVGYFMPDYYGDELHVEGADVQGFQIGYYPTTRAGPNGVRVGGVGVPVPRTGSFTQTITDSFLRNKYNVYLTNHFNAASCAHCNAPRIVRIINVTYGTPPGLTLGVNHWHIYTGLNLSSSSVALAQQDELYVDGYNGTAENFRVYWKEAGRNVAFMQSIFHDPPTNSPGNEQTWACPSAGMTNLQCWNAHTVAWGGSLPPVDANDTDHPEIWGLTVESEEACASSPITVTVQRWPRLATGVRSGSQTWTSAGAWTVTTAGTYSVKFAVAPIRIIVENEAGCIVTVNK